LEHWDAAKPSACVEAMLQFVGLDTRGTHPPPLTFRRETLPPLKPTWQLRAPHSHLNLRSGFFPLP
jgi:hypothetical protein